MDINSILILLGLVPSLIASGVSIVALILGKRNQDALAKKTDKESQKADAEAAAIYSDLATDNAKRVQELEDKRIKDKEDYIKKIENLEDIIRTTKRALDCEMSELRKDLEEKDFVIKELLLGIKILTTQLNTKGDIPEWTPSEELMTLAEKKRK